MGPNSGGGSAVTISSGVTFGPPQQPPSRAAVRIRHEALAQSDLGLAFASRIKEGSSVLLVAHVDVRLQDAALMLPELHASRTGEGERHRCVGPRLRLSIPRGQE
jgi:hypothetical protein